MVEGQCFNCRQLRRNLIRVRVVESPAFGRLSATNRWLCQLCINKEYFYVDKDGFVKLNRVKVTKTSSIMEEKKT